MHRPLTCRGMRQTWPTRLLPARRHPPRWTDGTVLRVARAVVRHVARESIGEYFIRSVRLAVLHRLEHHLVASLRLGGAIPAAVERDEGALPVLRREALARIEQQVVRRPVRGVCDQRIRIFAGSLLLCRRRTPGRARAAEPGVEEGVRPAVVAAVDDLVELLGLARGVVFRVVERGEQRVERRARESPRTARSACVPLDGHGIAHARCEAQPLPESG
jgi:hypothetical protein